MPTPRPRRALPDWVAEHVRQYIATDGEEGHIWKGTPTLLLTTLGRLSQEPLTIPLTYGKVDGGYLVVASRGGSRRHPDWYKNLIAEPNVRVQVAAEVFDARARPASEDERPAFWRIMTDVTPAYDDYQAKTTREIPVVLLERR